MRSHQRIQQENHVMIERLLKQQSSINQIEMNKREKLQKRLLLSMNKSDKLPPAFWMPNRQPFLIRNMSGRSSLSASSRKGSRAALDT